MTPVAWFKDVGIADRPTVGGKGGSLGELTQAGIAVPPGFVVTTAAFELFLEALEARAPVRGKVAALDPTDLGAATKLSEELRRRVIEEPMPAEVEKAIRVAHAELSPNDQPVAVRSSATTEDADDASFAGLQDTFLWVLGPDQMVARVRECWGSLYSVESMTYRLKHDLPEDGVAMAVVVQRMVDAMCAGVMFTRSPLTGDRSVVAIDASWGLGSAVVSGDVTPDSFLVNKVTGEITRRTVSTKTRWHQPDPSGHGVVETDVPTQLQDVPSINDAEIAELYAIARKVEAHYGCPQDIEWAVSRTGDPGENVFLLQSRPETVWAEKDRAAKVAAPTARAFDHVFNVLGGKRPTEH
jgi:pyruvate, water dikinase